MTEHSGHDFKVINGCRVLIADDEESLRFVLRELLAREGFQIDEAEDGRQAVELACRKGYDLYLLDMKMPGMDGLEALREIRTHYPDALVVMITAFGSTQLAVDALKLGAYDYFTKPFNIEELRIILLRALEKQRLLRHLQQLQQQLGAPRRLDRMIGQCPPMQQVFEMIQRVAEHDVTVLLSGESGTGKELVARAIHTRSARRDGPFVTVNCAAIPDTLLESELFGHEKGAFTGATCARLGKFEVADEGTILLDEIAELPLGLQAKLLRALQEHEIERVGANHPRTVNIRVVAATNRDLARMVADHTFREDLYFRINVMQLVLPPLRERHADILPLVQHFISEYNVRFGKRVEGVAPEAMARLEHYGWPGNVRELENVMQRSMVLSSGPMIGLEALPTAVKASASTVSQIQTLGAGLGPNSLPGGSNGSITAPVDFSLPLARRMELVVEQEEQQMIRAALTQTAGHRQRTADLLHISRKSLHNKMQKYGLFTKEQD